MRANNSASLAEMLASYEAELTRRGWKVRTRDAWPGFAQATFDALAGTPRRGVLTLSEDVVSAGSKMLSFRFEKVPAAAP